MTIFTGVEALAIVVDRHGAIDHLVETVAIDVADRERMEALSTVAVVALAVLATSAVLRVKVPAAGELTVTIVPSLKHGLCIDATPQDNRWQHAVEASHGHAQRGSPLEVVVAPLLTGASGNVVGTGKFPAGQPVNDTEEFGAGLDVVLVVLAVVGLSVAVEVAHADIVGLIPDGVAVAHILGVLQGNLNVGQPLRRLVGCHGVGGERNVFLSSRCQPVGVGLLAVGRLVLIAGLALDATVGEQHLGAPVSRAINVEGGVLVVTRQHAP